MDGLVANPNQFALHSLFFELLGHLLQGEVGVALLARATIDQ